MKNCPQRHFLRFILLLRCYCKHINHHRFICHVIFPNDGAEREKLFVGNSRLFVFQGMVESIWLWINVSPFIPRKQCGNVDLIMKFSVLYIETSYEKYSLYKQKNLCPWSFLRIIGMTYANINNFQEIYYKYIQTYQFFFGTSLKSNLQNKSCIHLDSFSTPTLLKTQSSNH